MKSLSTHRPVITVDDLPAEALSFADQEPVVICRTGKPRYVLMTIPDALAGKFEYEDHQRAVAVEDAPPELVEALEKSLAELKTKNKGDEQC